MGSLGEKKPYSLPRDASESTRLNTQHEVYVSAAGYVLHPRIASSLKGDVRVAEVATGTGVWLKDLASSSPSNWTFTGLDMSAAQFPQAKDIPKNTTFEVLNILEPVPAKHRGQYDILHMRLLVCGLTGDDWTTAASNALQLLRPGGWLQWHEGDFADLEALQNVPGARTTATQRLLTDAVHGHRAYGKLRKGDVANLIGTVKHAGFEDCEDDRCSSDRVPSMRPLAKHERCVITLRRTTQVTRLA